MPAANPSTQTYWDRIYRGRPVTDFSGGSGCVSGATLSACCDPYYLHFVLRQIGDHWGDTHRGVTNYKTLLDDLEKWRLQSDERVCLVTFNYDTLLESALSAVRVTISAIDDYTRNENYKVIKVHGSVNWGHELAIDVEDLMNRNVWEVVNEYIERAAELKFGDTYHVTSEYPIAWGMHHLGSRRVPLFPAIALPVVRKSKFECPSEHLRVLEESLPQVTKIITVGWRANEEHFLDLLRKKPARNARLMVVSRERSEAQEICLKLSETGIGKDFHQAEGGFTGAILNGEIAYFLNRS